MSAEVFQVIGIVIGIIVVCWWFWKISVLKYPGFTSGEHKADKKARREIRKQLKEEEKRRKNVS